MKPYNYNPELAISPPEISEAEYQRIWRNDLRDEILDAISLIDSRLGELDETAFSDVIVFLATLREQLRQDMED